MKERTGAASKPITQRPEAAKTECVNKSKSFANYLG